MLDAGELHDAAVAQLVAAQQQQLGGFKRAAASADAIKDAETSMQAGAPPARTPDLPERAGGELDFYAYRYLDSEAPSGCAISALQAPSFSRKGGEFIARQCFLAINEFAPDNVIYHEGAGAPGQLRLVAHPGSRKAFCASQAVSELRVPARGRGDQQ